MLNFEQSWNNMLLDAEAETGELLNDAVYKRNRQVEEMCNIILKEVVMSDVDSAVISCVSGDSGDFDVAWGRTQNMMNLAQDGYLLDLYEDIPYIDLSKPWWTKSANDSFSIINRLFVGVNDISLSYLNIAEKQGASSVNVERSPTSTLNCGSLKLAKTLSRPSISTAFSNVLIKGSSVIARYGMSLLSFRMIRQPPATHSDVYSSDIPKIPNISSLSVYLPSPLMSVVTSVSIFASASSVHFPERTNSYGSVSSYCSAIRRFIANGITESK